MAPGCVLVFVMEFSPRTLALGGVVAAASTKGSLWAVGRGWDVPLGGAPQELASGHRNSWALPGASGDLGTASL